MQFLIDAQLPPKLARALIDLGYQAEHLEDIGLRHAKEAKSGIMQRLITPSSSVRTKISWRDFAAEGKVPS